MTTDITFPTSLLDVEYPISATEVKPLGQFTEEDCYGARQTLTFAQPELVSVFEQLEVELGQQPNSSSATVAELPARFVRDLVGNAPTPRSLNGSPR